MSAAAPCTTTTIDRRSAICCDPDPIIGRPVRFELPEALEAHEPAEARTGSRDAVRLLVSEGRAAPVDHQFRDLPFVLRDGDLLVVNTSRTLAAAFDARRRSGDPVVIHLSTRLPADLWVIEVRLPDGPHGTTRPFAAVQPGETLLVDDGRDAVHLLRPYPGSHRLWVAQVELPPSVDGWLADHGRPIRYGYVPDRWPIDAYQSVFAIYPGSAEMPSASRPFTADLVTHLVARGVGVTPITLHTGVSSPETHEPPYPEPFAVPRSTADRVNDAHRHGGRVIAVGTTVARAVEAAADERGIVHPVDGWAEVIITPTRGVRAIDGLLTGWHEPEASHLLMLEAVAGRQPLRLAYEHALHAGYLWHEFGDVHLILRDSDSPVSVHL
ncbi:MAG: S-adenosylmethionine:tRNA ribosyltransferase-isomerase [Actinobacteria bacterium]|nr:S-adenosylmethionine:tRNA ribosyltransferase-isomerase [Actinomycetota bacterium]